MISRVSARAVMAALAVVALVAGCGLRRETHHVPDDLIPVFQAAAATYGLLTAAQLAAQARVESKFDAQAVSRAGARGMMQFLPSTWADFGIDGNHDGRADPMDPRDAIPSAARYESTLARLVEHLPGDRVSLVLAAYNAGPDAVRAAGGVPDIDETRTYVSRVNTWAAAFADQL
ncbi:lytic transglycosylase domain-containing protein [Frankia sp. AgB32]|uniref:lytic transglycosylase domain-containing protein n=1 Tax=Frankia sp. AgB32 TaxID=631119 RepID=UPI00200D61B5|nr:lytic transglycosylase domain-containing protein [Frankia sp. AgB32]MCK9897375.1 lytic transglycosylase domain-containing protein [Frankia sp. AgB32]